MESRIVARRKRAEQKLERDKEEAEGKKTGAEEAQAADVSRGRTQISESVARMEQVKTETWNGLTQVRVAFDDAENQRRIVEEAARLDRYEALQIEAVTSGRKNAAVEMKWADLLNLEIPQELHEQLRMQKEACQTIIDAKDRRIREFETELKNKNEEYVKVLKQMALDVGGPGGLIAKMRLQYQSLRNEYEEQLDATENAFIQERTELRDRHKVEMEELFEKRKRMEETDFLEERQKRERDFQEKTDMLRINHADEFNQSKIALEKSIQDLEQHLEKMMATYQLNKEKLEYNLQVLTERYKEHSAIQSQYKNRLNRLRETLNTLMGRYHKMDGKYRQENIELTEEYKRLTQQFQDLQEKFKHFEQADDRQFREIWQLNEANVRQLMSKVLDADRIIHEQQLGLEWTPPREDLLLQELETFSEAGTTTGKSTAKESEDQGPASSGKFSIGKVKKVLDLIKEETGFLLDMKIREQMADLPPEQRDVMQIDAVLRYIGVESQEDVDLLVQQFYQGQDEDDETLMVDADEVLNLLKKYQEEKENLAAQVVAPGKEKKKSKGKAMGSESEAERKLRRRKEEKKFWEKMGHVIPEMNTHVWKALDRFLQKYYDLLQRRSGAIDSAVSLQKQNEELKALLDQYLSSRVNDELQVPPTHVIRTAPAGQQTLPRAG
jgi:dynein regulatory complex protein 1